VREEAEKLKEAERGNVVYFLAASSCLWLTTKPEKLGARIRDRQVARQKATEDQDVAIRTAVDNATSELRSATSESAASEELSKQHAEELRALEERLMRSTVRRSKRQSKPRRPRCRNLGCVTWI
jgi:hypothetical protein